MTLWCHCPMLQLVATVFQCTQNKSGNKNMLAMVKTGFCFGGTFIDGFPMFTFCVYLHYFACSFLVEVNMFLHNLHKISAGKVIEIKENSKQMSQEIHLLRFS